MLRDIDHILLSSPDLGSSFSFNEIKDLSGSTKKPRFFELNEAAFTLLAFGFTGEEAMGFKVSYIKEFSRMRDHIRLNSPEFDPNDPSQLRERLIGYTRMLEGVSRAETAEERALRLDRRADQDAGAQCCSSSAVTVAFVAVDGPRASDRR